MMDMIARCLYCVRNQRREKQRRDHVDITYGLLIIFKNKSNKII